MEPHEVIRVDYYDQPDAPPASVILPGASAIVMDDRRRLLVHKRTDNGLWALPGGAMMLGESIADTARREVLEETGLAVRPDYVVGVYTDPRHVFTYDEGRALQEFSVCVACSLIGGRLAASEESSAVDWCPVDEIDRLSMHPRIRVRIDDFLAGRRAVLG